MTSITSLCVFCGSKAGKDPACRDSAVELGRLMADCGVRLVYGGGGIGLMGVLSDAVLDSGGEVQGVIPDFLVRYEVANPNITETVVTGSMHERKQKMFELSDGFVVLPGGLGTLDEAIEVITWKQLQLHAKPMVVVNVGGYWDPLAALVDGVIAGGFAHPGVAELFTMVDGVGGVFEALQSASEPKAEVLTDHF